MRCSGACNGTISIDSPGRPDPISSSIRKGTFFGVVASVAQVGTRFVTVPIVIAHIGLDGYGIWNVIALISGYLRFGTVGVKAAFQKYVADATGNGDYGTASRLLSTGSALMVPFAVGGVITASQWSVALASATGVPASFLRPAAHAISILALTVALSSMGAAYEAMVAGAHRIDLIRKLKTAFSIGEAVAIVLALSLGYGLPMMASVMGASELAYVVCCYWASRRIIPQVRVRWQFITWKLCPELFRFAGSYQLLNILEVVYASVVPFAVLSAFGAGPAGVYAIATRVVSTAGMFQEAFLPALLSAGATVFSMGSEIRMRELIAKAFRTTLWFSMIPMSYVVAVGGTIAYAWTGEVDATLGIAIALVSVRAVFQSLSLTALVLYRTSGKALYDNFRQVLRVVLLAAVGATAKSLDFTSVLVGMVLVELFGMVLMIMALKRTFAFIQIRRLVQDVARFAVATAVIAAAGALLSHVPLSPSVTGRPGAFVVLITAAAACIAVAYPVTVWTGALTSAERGAVLDVFKSRSHRLINRWASRRRFAGSGV